MNGVGGVKKYIVFHINAIELMKSPSVLASKRPPEEVRSLGVRSEIPEGKLRWEWRTEKHCLSYQYY